MVGAFSPGLFILSPKKPRRCFPIFFKNMTQIKIEHKMLAGFCLAAALNMGILGIGLRSSARYRDRNQWVAHSLEVEAQLARVRFQEERIGRCKFLFLITGDAQYAAARREALLGTEQEISVLQRLTTDNAPQQRDIEALRLQVAERARQGEKSLALQQRGRSAEARAAFLTEKGMAATQRINAKLDQMEREESRLLTGRRADSEREAKQSEWALLLLGSGLAALLATLFVIGKSVGRQQRNAHEKVEHILESIQDGFFAVDRNWNFTYVNGEAKRMWGMEGIELVGQNLWEVHANARGTEFERQNTRALTEQIVVQYEEYYPTHGIWYEVRVYPSPEGLSLYFRDSTARRAAREAIERSEKSLNDAQELAHIGSWEADLVTRTSHWSPEMSRIFGVAPNDPTPTFEESLRLVHPDDRDSLMRRIQETIQNAQPFESQHRLLLPDGSLRYVDARFHAVRENGAVTRLMGTAQDVTERKQAEERFRILFEQSSDAHLLLDDTGIMDCNRAAIALLRCNSKAELLAMHPAVLSPVYQPDGRLSSEKAVEMDALAHQNGFHRFEWTHRKADGATFLVEVSLTPVTLNEKPILLVVLHDLTERKRAEEALRQSHAKLTALIEGIPDILYRVNAQGVCVDYIASRKEHVCYQANECVGKHLSEVLPPHVARLMQDAIEKALATKIAQMAEYTLTVAGETRFREARIVAQSEEESLIIVRDITDRRIAEQRMDSLNRQNQLLLESIGEGVYGINLEGNATFANPAAAALLGYTPDEILGRNLHALFHHTKMDGSPYPVAECPIYRAMRQGEVFHSSDEVFWRKDGSSFAVEYTAMPILIDEMVVGVVVSFQDITARRHLETQIEEQLLQMNEYSVELEFQKSELEAANQQLERLATTDGLTGLNNHRNFQTRFAEIFQLANRYGNTVSVLLLDVDHFKQFNDTFGHPAGDQTLKTVANALTLAARTTDFVARYGGEEFAVILPETDAQGAIEAAERFRAAVEAQEWPARAVTVSIGVATWNLATETPSALLQQADDALYVSKRNGRNRATHASRKEGVRC